MNNKRYSLLLASVIIFVTSGYLYASASETLPNTTFEPNCINQYKIIDIYLKAVDRGEVEVFGKALDRSMLVPTRIEYDLELSGLAKNVNIHSKLKQPIEMSDQNYGVIHEICTTIDADGNVISTRAHVWPANQSSK